MLRRRPRQEASSGAVEAGAEASAPQTVAQRIELDYPVNPRPRFGHGSPPHPELAAIIGAGREVYRERAQLIVEQKELLRKIAVHDAPPDEPRWVNGFLPGLDGAALYSLIASEAPATYLEVGSGNSTLFARRAVRDHGVQTRIVSIDPTPRAAIDAICDHVIRRPLEDVDLSLFADLRSGDIVFVDNSHRVFTNSDATVVFLELLPRLAPGVHLHVHDIFLPEDYPAAWNDRFYSEQYLLAAFLLGGSACAVTEFPAWYVANDDELSAMLAPLWDDPALAGVERHGNSYWMRTVAPGP
jgi:predicted O-methyltransferase YrrM